MPGGAARGSYIRDAVLKAYKPNLYERIENNLGNALQGIGIDKGARRFAKRATSFLNDLTPVGDVVTADKARQAWKRKDYPAAAGNALLAAVGAIPGVGDAAAGVSKAMFLGVKAKNANREALRQATEMATRGANRDDIWKQTGWGKGADDQWRFEIDDAQLKAKADGWELPAHPRRVRGLREPGSVTEPELNWLRKRNAEDDLGATNIDEVVAYQVGKPRQEAVSHPELAAAYSDTDGLAFSRIKADTKEGGYFNESEGLIGVNPDFQDSARSVLGHELQHFVQGQEGFARGGNPMAFAVERREADRIIQNYNDILRRYANEIDMAVNPAEKAAAKAQYDAVMAAKLRIVPEAQIDPYESYRRLAGEVEARNVQTRLDFTPEQRRASPPWLTQDVPDDQQIVRFR